MKHCIKPGILFLFFLFSFITLKSENSNIPCIVYHRIGDNRYSSTNCSINDFEQHLHHLKQNGFQTIKASEISNNNKAKAVVLTFDDGYRSVLSNAIPLLKEYNFTATVYINPQLVGGSEYLSWQEIRALKKDGFEFGNHSNNHSQFVSSNNDKDLTKAFSQDLKESHNQFKKHLKCMPESYAFPYGESSAIMRKILRQHNYKLAFVQHSGIFNKTTDRLSIPRFSMTGTLSSLKRFKQALKMQPLILQNPIGNSIITRKNKSDQLEYDILTKNLNYNSFQLFINGKKSEKFRLKSKENRIILSSTRLDTRRTKFTITAQSLTNPQQWYWFTLLIIKPDLPE